MTDGTGIVLLTFKLFAADPAIGEEIMIKHVVMWKLKETAMGATKYENALAMKKRLEGLQEKIPELQSAEVGINIKVSPTASDVVLISTFSSEEALETYMNHPEHKRVADFVSSVRLERSVVDYIVK
ncbi:MAG: Dabb family protein [Chitinivibrionales bacterium]